MRNIMELPAVKRMLELDVWGKEQGLDSDKRAAVVSAISALIASSDVEIAKEYIRRATDVIADLGPKALSGE